jgi:uncharacterized membrane protein YcaP (DUF421 family)
VALGSALANVILSKDVSLAQGGLALALLCLLQLLVTWLSVRSDRFQRLVKSTPALLLYEGEFQGKAMRRERVTEAEIRSALRGQGICAVEKVAAVILETDGTFSVIRQWQGDSRSALVDVAGWSEEQREGQKGTNGYSRRRYGRFCGGDDAHRHSPHDRRRRKGV